MIDSARYANLVDLQKTKDTFWLYIAAEAYRGGYLDAIESAPLDVTRGLTKAINKGTELMKRASEGVG